MSPPCQPYTRQHPPTENDLRNNALTNLIATLKKLTNPPTYLALENVIGFEKSPSCSALLDTLESVGYRFMQFALSPTQFGIPNERPRYYLIALYDSSFKSDSRTKGKDSDKKSCIDAASVSASKDVHCDVSSHVSKKRSSRELHTKIPGQLVVETLPLSSYLSQSLSTLQLEELLVPQTLLEKNASWCMDIVTANDRSTSCFTKSYSKYCKGTGSVLMIPDLSTITTETTSELKVLSPMVTSQSELVALNDNRSNDGENNDNTQTFLSEASGFADTTVQLDNAISTVIPEQLISNCPETNVVLPSTDNPLFRIAPEKRKFDMDWKDQLKGHKLRFFSPDELIRLFGFAGIDSDSSNLITDKSDTEIFHEENVEKEKRKNSFFPPHISKRKCYELIGNSLNVIVVSNLLQLLFNESEFNSANNCESEISK